MALFGRKPKTTPKTTQPSVTNTSAAVSVVNAAMENADNVASQQKKLDETRKAQEIFNNKLYSLANDIDVSREMKKQALKNEERLQKLEERYKAALENLKLNPNSSSVVQEMETRRSLYNNFNPKDNGDGEEDAYIYDSIYILDKDTDTYIKNISKLSVLFSEKASSEAIDSGANLIFENGFDVYVDQLEEALQKGRKIKVNACFDVFKYVLKVAYSKPVTFEDQDPIEVFHTRMEVVSKVAKQLIKDIDNYYELLEELELNDDEYKKAKLLWVEKRDAMETVPEKLRQQLMNLDMKGAMQQIPNGSNVIRQYYPIIFDAKTVLVRTYLKSYEISSAMLALTELRNGINEMLTELKKAFIKSGKTYDAAAHIKMLEEINTRNIKNAQELEKRAIHNQQLNEKIDSLLKSAQNNPLMGQSVAHSTQDIFAQMKLDEEEEALKRAITKRANELKERKAKQQKMDIETDYEEVGNLNKLEVEE